MANVPRLRKVRALRAMLSQAAASFASAPAMLTQSAGLAGSAIEFDTLTDFVSG